MTTAKLGDGNAYAPFRFHLGDEVASRKGDGTPDPEMHGVIVGGSCEYQEGGGSYSDVYEVKRSDGTFFQAGSLELMKREPPFGSNIREAARVIREWVSGEKR